MNSNNYKPLGLTTQLTELEVVLSTASKESFIKALRAMKDLADGWELMITYDNFEYDAITYNPETGNFTERCRRGGYVLTGEKPEIQILAKLTNAIDERRYAGKRFPQFAQAVTN